jgi:hypothetical protein
MAWRFRYGKKGGRNGISQVLGDMLFLYIGVAGTGSMANAATTKNQG